MNRHDHTPAHNDGQWIEMSVRWHPDLAGLLMLSYDDVEMAIAATPRDIRWLRDSMRRATRASLRGQWALQREREQPLTAAVTRLADQARHDANQRRVRRFEWRALVRQLRLVDAAAEDPDELGEDLGEPW